MEVDLRNASIHIQGIYLNDVEVSDRVKEELYSKLERGLAVIGLADKALVDLESNINYTFTFDVDEFTEYKYYRK